MTPEVAQPDRLSLLGVRIVCHDARSLLSQIRELVQGGEHALIPNVNAHCLNLAYQNPWLLKFLNGAHSVYSDGAGVQLAASLLGLPVPVRLTFVDFIWELGVFCQVHGFSLYFLGARPGIADRAAAVLHEKLPELKIAGVHHGYFDKRKGSAENQRVVKEINESRPSILIVGFGMPVQEAWLGENWLELDANVGLTAGALFDYLSGAVRRPPRWMTNNGLEWLGRLLIEPRRLWRRYLIGNPLFLWRVFGQRFRPTAS
jgi:N-acetylglucosaminyldiphosphoundecaprenol N-acetyl-beta-D-mannosaminyltransferase